MKRNAHEAPGSCPLCGEVDYREYELDGHSIRHYECGIEFNRHTGLVDFFPKFLDGIRAVSREHFRRQLEATPFDFA